jgi:hypothetical protein
LVKIFIKIKNFDNLFFLLGERVDTSIFCSSVIKSNQSISEINQPQIYITPYTEIQSENQITENVCLN